MRGEEMTKFQESIIAYMGDEVVPRCSEKRNLICGLVQKRCPDFFTCSPSGITENNLKQIENFKIGQDQLNSRECSAASWTKDKIIKLVYISITQGTLRYEYKVGLHAGGERADVPEKLEAEGVIFMAGVIGSAHTTSPEATQMIGIP